MAEQQARRAAAIRELWRGDPTASEPNLFAIVAAARDPAIYPALYGLQGQGATVVPLYQGRALAELAPVGPYIVSVSAGGAAFDWLWGEGWGRAWCIYLWTLVSAGRLRDHLRRHTYARSEDGSMLMFRFYDPRVLRALLPVLDAAQQQSLFGPISRFSVEAPELDSIIHFQHLGRGMAQITRRLT